jgi:hypothetical protein
MGSASLFIFDGVMRSNSHQFTPIYELSVGILIAGEEYDMKWCQHG